MGISIQDKSATFPSTFPQFGQIVRPDLLKIGFRGFNALNDINLSDSDIELTRVNVMTYAQDKQGVLINSDNTGHYISDYAPTKNQYTLFAIFKFDIVDSNSTFLMGNFISSAYFMSETPPIDVAPSGRGILLSYNGTTRTLTARLTRLIYNTATNRYGNNYIDLPLTLNAGSTGFVCVAFSVSARGVKAGVLSTSSSLTIQNIHPSYSTDDQYLNDGWIPAPMRIGGNYTDPRSPSTSELRIQEVLYFDDALSENELEQQYQLSKRIMQNRGLNVGSWR